MKLVIWVLLVTVIVFVLIFLATMFVEVALEQKVLKLAKERIPLENILSEVPKDFFGCDEVKVKQIIRHLEYAGYLSDKRRTGEDDKEYILILCKKYNKYRECFGWVINIITFGRFASWWY